VLAWLYRIERLQHRPLYQAELLAAARAIAAQTKGSPAWPEAALYLGLCAEYAGCFTGLSREFPTVGDLYRAALGAAPPPSPEVEAQLRYRLGMYEYLSEYYGRMCARDLRPGVSIDAAGNDFTELQRTVGSDIRTWTGASMLREAGLFAEACQSPAASLTGVRALLEVRSDMLVGNAKGEARELMEFLVAQVDIRESVMGYLEDTSIPASDRSRFALELAQLYSWCNDRDDMVQTFADIALRVSDGSNPQAMIHLLAMQADLAYGPQLDIAAARAFAEQARKLCEAEGLPVPAGVGFILRRHRRD
jgi:hypothetical protein